MMDKEQFYPTPEELAKELLAMADFRKVNTILEPSAGTGALLEAVKNRNPYNDRYSYHCIEQNAERRATLQGKDYTVIWDDFLTFSPVTPYNTILMNISSTILCGIRSKQGKAFFSCQSYPAQIA